MTVPADTKAVRALLRERVDAAGSQRSWASAHGLSHSYVGEVLRGSRAPSARVLAALGLEKKVTFAPVEGGRP